MERNAGRQVSSDWRSMTTHNGGFNTEGGKLNVEM
jgi:hypothetical protein